MKSNKQKIQSFVDGRVLLSSELNALYTAIINIGKQYGLILSRKVTWLAGTTLEAKELNSMLDDIYQIYKFARLNKPRWSFGEFKDGQILRASHLNELVKAVNCLKKQKGKLRDYLIKHPDGSYEPKQQMVIKGPRGKVTLNPGVRLKPGVKFMGIDILDFLD